jgi:metal-dependent amidase/aminoacylase/carboxypeptidase family protein
MNDNPVLVELFERNLRVSGVEPGPPDPNLGSSDMGNVSWVVPAIHPCLAICDAGTPGHSIAFRDAAAAPRADEVTLVAATVIAQTAYDLFRDPDAVAAAGRAFAESRR